LTVKSGGTMSTGNVPFVDVLEMPFLFVQVATASQFPWVRVGVKVATPPEAVALRVVTAVGDNWLSTASVTG
jgi:hypothetical protein